MVGNKLRNILFKKQVTPPFLIFFVTSKCNLRCAHCFNWQKIDKSTVDLDLSTIERLSKELGPVYNLLLSGGEPCLREDLPAITEMFCKNNYTEKISLPTNGYRPQVTEDMTKNILSLIGGVSLEVQLSLDGPRDIHDLIRGCIGSFAKVIESYEVLKSLKKHFPNLRINVAVTITNKNIQYLGKLKDYIQGNMSLVDSVFWGFWRDSARDSDIFLPEGKDLEDLQKINNSCQSSFVSAVLSDLFFNMKIKLIKSKKQIVDCAAGRLIGVIDNDGDVRFCETLAPIGNLKESSFIDIWHGEKAEGLRKKIKEQKCYCTHECFLAPSTLYNPGNYYKIIPELFCSLGRSRVRSRGQKMREQ